ncbi:hypothetical protein C5E16_10420 [Clavibacter michiganensis]|uniref:Uncharacterized protein n=1 Tax=Clavibacter michiganensis TaxID=28447 RepID=A0A2S5VT07_9MICO|nr:hypothetical protein [Clavibacter michiganensis]PPF66867.1 hypothetical protein C5E16_10420 [Clavibacter michiganensis]
MTADDAAADDTTADTAAPTGPPAQAAPAAPPEDPGHGRRRMARIGARALVAWIAEVVTPRRRLVALGSGLVAGVAMALLIRPVLARADGEATSAAAAVLLGIMVGAAVGIIPVSVWLTRAIRRHPSVTGSHPSWRDSALLDRAVDARGRVTIQPGTAERVATESRRAIASAAVGVPGAVVMGVLVLVGAPAYAVTRDIGMLGWFLPVYALLSVSGLWTSARTAGPMALLRDAADAELALPESERPPAPPPPAPPQGSRLP